MSVKICIVGAGALGGALCAHLCAADAELSLVARGAALERIRTDGLHYLLGGERRQCRPQVADRAPQAPQDLLVLAGKSQHLGAMVEALGAALGPRTAVLTLANGVPWWFGATPAEPAGFARVRASVAAHAALGAAVYAMAEASAPGVVVAARPPLLVLGELDGARSARLERIAALFAGAGLGIRLAASIRREVWKKIVANLGTNPLSVATGASLLEMHRDPDLHALVAAMYAEGLRTAAAASGEDFSGALDELLEATERAGPHRTSMLQDFAAGRPLELDSVGRAVLALGERHGVAMPVSAAMVRLAAGLERARDRDRQCSAQTVTGLPE